LIADRPFLLGQAANGNGVKDMRKNERARIQKIVEIAIIRHDAQMRAAEAASRQARHLRRRILIVLSVVTVIIVTHHLTRIEPVGRIGEMTFGALFSWFFDKATRGE
jgi:hypothetical protein